MLTHLSVGSVWLNPHCCQSQPFLELGVRLGATAAGDWERHKVPQDNIINATLSQQECSTRLLLCVVRVCAWECDSYMSVNPPPTGSPTHFLLCVVCGHLLNVWSPLLLCVAWERSTVSSCCVVGQFSSFFDTHTQHTAQTPAHLLDVLLEPTTTAPSTLVVCRVCHFFCCVCVCYALTSCVRVGGVYPEKPSSVVCV